MLNLKSNVAVIIVTHNSEKHIDKCLACVGEQKYSPSQVILVDSGSTDKSYLDKYVASDNIQVIFGENAIGFCRGNNLALSHVKPEVQYLFF